jgi:hypothetical protein
MTYVSVTVCDTLMSAPTARPVRDGEPRAARGASPPRVRSLAVRCRWGVEMGSWCVVCRVSGLIYLAAYRCGLATAPLHGHPTAVHARPGTDRTTGRQTAGAADWDAHKGSCKEWDEGMAGARSESTLLLLSSSSIPSTPACAGHMSLRSWIRIEHPSMTGDTEWSTN